MPQDKADATIIKNDVVRKREVERLRQVLMRENNRTETAEK